MYSHGEYHKVINATDTPYLAANGIVMLQPDDLDLGGVTLYPRCAIEAVRDKYFDGDVRVYTINMGRIIAEGFDPQYIDGMCLLFPTTPGQMLSVHCLNEMVLDRR